MSANTICSTCRHAAAQLRPRRLLRQPNARQSFVSLAQTATATANDAPPPIAAQPQASVTPKPRSSPPKTKKTKSKSKGKKFHTEPKSDLLEELFLGGLKPNNRATLKPKTADLDLYPHVERLLELLNKPNAPIKQIWTLFATEICPRVLPKDAPTPYSLHFASKSLFRKLVTAHRKHPVPEGVPSVSDIARTYACMGLMSPRDWNPMLDTLFTKETYDRLPISGDKIAEDMLETWRVILTHPSYVGQNPSECRDTTWVTPQLNAAKIQRDVATDGIEKAFESLLPQHRHKPLQGMASRALVTFALLTHPRLQPPISLVESHPLIKGLADIMVMAKITPTMLTQYFKTRELPYIATLNIEWSSVIDQARRLAGLEAITLPLRSKPPSLHMPGSEHRIFKSLARAISIKDLDTVTSLWDQVRTWPQPSPGQSPISRELGHQFIVAFTAMNKPLAVEVWNALTSWGLPPTVATWHAMLEGLRNARDIKSLHGLWKRMADMGVQPDAGCWTTFISALMFSGDLEGGVRAVVLMKNTWENAAREYLSREKLQTPLSQLGDIDGIVKPTTSVINAVTTTLLRKNKVGVASRVLSMGGDLGLRPDALTYNTILRSLVRKGDEAALKALLEQMEKQGIKGDIVTFTTTLERSLANVEDSTPTEVVQLIDSLFAEMEATGIKPNETTCSAIINSVLRQAPSLEYLVAAEHVVSKMEAMGLKPTAHIQTMFIDFHFMQSSPDLDAVGLLVEKFTRLKLHRDHIFWDRVIEGYSALSESDRALQAVRQCTKENCRPGYYALEQLVKALVRNGEVTLAKELVEDVGMDRGGPIHADIRGKEGQHDFWNCAESLGLFTSEQEEKWAALGRRDL